MIISRELVLIIIKYIIDNPEFYFPFSINNLYFDKDKEEFIVKFSLDEYKKIKYNDAYTNFILSENLQNLHSETIELMSKGFIEKIIKKSKIDKISSLAIKYRKEWKEELWESEDIEEYGLNEFIGGKAEAYEECLEILKVK